jgi:curved DNA-binding protein CbpA
MKKQIKKARFKNTCYTVKNVSSAGTHMTSSTGEITTLTLPRLLQDIRQGRKTGTAVFERSDASTKVFFRHGEIVYASSNSDDQSMRTLLENLGKITKAQSEKSADIMRKTNKKLITVLFEMGLLKPQELVAHVKLLVKQNILGLFSLREGRYRFDDGLLPGAEIVPLQMNAGELILAGIRGIAWEDARRSLPPLNTVISRAPEPSLPARSADLIENERTVLSLIDAKSSIQELCCLTNIGEEAVLKSLFVLLALRMASEGKRKDQQETVLNCHSVREVAAVEQRPMDQTAAESLITREMLQSAHDVLALQDYYEMLGVGRSASPQEIKKAYFGLAKLYHPDRHSDPELRDMKQKLELLFASINEAYGVLSETKKRDQYNLDLSSGTKQYGKKDGKPADEDDESQKVSAVAQFTEGMKQFRVQNFWGAEEAFRWATRLDPSNPDYVYHLGLALAHMPRRRHEAEEYFQKAVTMAPSRVEYYLELGGFYEKNGLKPKALSVYQDALKRNPNSDKVKQAVKNAGG